jgi:hypothetical protein
LPLPTTVRYLVGLRRCVRPGASASYSYIRISRHQLKCRHQCVTEYHGQLHFTSRTAAGGALEANDHEKCIFSIEVTSLRGEIAVSFDHSEIDVRPMSFHELPGPCQVGLVHSITTSHFFLVDDHVSFQEGWQAKPHLDKYLLHWSIYSQSP